MDGSELLHFGFAHEDYIVVGMGRNIGVNVAVAVAARCCSMQGLAVGMQNCSMYFTEYISMQCLRVPP